MTEPSTVLTGFPGGMRVTRCAVPGCPQPVILIEHGRISDPEQLLAVEAERAGKTAAHQAQHHGKTA